MAFPVALAAAGLNLGATLMGQSAMNKEAVRARWAMEDEARRRNALLEELLPVYQQLMQEDTTDVGYGPWSPDFINSAIMDARNDYMDGANRDIALTERNLQGRNISLASSPMVNAEAVIRSNARNDFGRVSNQIRTTGAQARADAERAARQDRLARLSALLPTITNLQGMNASDIGGMATVMAQDARMNRGNVANAIGSVAEAGILNRRDGGRNSGNNRTGTNQSGIAPYSLADRGNPATNPFLMRPQNDPMSAAYTDSVILAPTPRYDTSLIR